MAEVTITVEKVTPAIAHEWLAMQGKNRGVRQRKVDAYARDMKAGKWKITGEPIIFNGTGKLMNGQHRLLACIQANSGFESAIARGVSDTAHAMIDVGMTRTLGDELRWRGEANYNLLAASLGVLSRYESGELPKQYVATTRIELLRVLDKNPGIRDWLQPAARIGKAVGITSTVFAVSCYLLSEEHGSDVAEAFLAHLESGVGYEEGDPCLALRGAVLRQGTARTFRPTTPEWLALTMKAINFWLMGRPVTTISWRSRGASKEPFPTLISKDELG